MDRFRKMLRAKIHRATVTEANLDYEGSITIPQELLEATDMREYEAVNVWNVTSGTRFETYVIRGAVESGEICVNGAAAHLVKRGDIIIIAAFTDVAESALESFEPRIAFVDEKNRLREIRREKAHFANGYS